jgi:hypothetical protein
MFGGIDDIRFSVILRRLKMNILKNTFLTLISILFFLPIKFNRLILKCGEYSRIFNFQKDQFSENSE